MSVSWSLRNRVAVTLAIYGAAVSLCLASIIYLASIDMEASLIDDTLTAELDDYVARRERNPLSLPERTATIRAYVVGAEHKAYSIPEVVRQLVPGRHDISVDGTSYRAAVRSVGSQRFVVLYDTNTLTERENRLLVLLAGSVLLVTIISAMVGRTLAARIIAPVTELARRVAELHPEDEPSPLADQFPWIEVRELAIDFEIYIKRLHEFIERERLFTGDVSHELRTPLAVIDGATELLLADGTIDKKYHGKIARISRATTEMGKITAALLALSREKGDTNSPPEFCDCTTVAREEIDRYRELFRHKPVKVSLEVRGIPSLRADHAILSMILGNLLRNAFNFTEKGNITVKIDTESISVEDEGPGLDTDNPEHLFQPYVRGGRSTGTGLGLSLVSRLCERQGWKLTLGNRPRGGTVASIDFTSSHSWHAA